MTKQEWKTIFKRCVDSASDSYENQRVRDVRYAMENAIKEGTNIYDAELWMKRPEDWILEENTDASVADAGWLTDNTLAMKDALREVLGDEVRVIFLTDNPDERKAPDYWVKLYKTKAAIRNRIDRKG